MQRKTIIILISILLIIGILAIGFYYFYQKKNSTTGANSDSSYNIFNPFGSGSNTTSDGTNTDTAQNGDTTTGDNAQFPDALSKMHKITEFAVAGATYFDDTRPIETDVSQTTQEAAQPTATDNTKTTNKKGTKVTTTKPVLPKFDIVPSLRYVESMTGHIYQMYLDTKVVGKVSNSTIPGITEAIFDGSAKSVVYRYLSSDTNTISSFIGTLGADKSEFLPSSIIDVSVSPDKTKLFYIVKNANGVTGSVRSFIETKTSQIWSSAYTEWVSQWATKDKIYLTTKASSGVNGSLFSMNNSNGSMSKVFGGIKGLTTLVNNDGSVVLYSTSTATGPELSVFNIKNHNSLNLGIQGLAEKCVWSADNVTVFCAVPNNISGEEYPDSWYQGLTSFDDHFSKVNTSTGEATEIISYNNPESVDAVKLFLNKDEDQLFFINKKDYTLWSLDLK